MLGKVQISYQESRRQFKCVELCACAKLYKAKERPGNSLVFSGGGLVAKLCLTLCDPKDCSPSGSSVHGIFQAKRLEWVAISFFSLVRPPRIGASESWFVDYRPQHTLAFSM